MSGWTPPRPDPFVELADQATHEAAVHARSAERDLRDRAAELAGWTGTLRDLAERGSIVTVRCASGRSHQGPLLAVAEDHLVLRLAGDRVIAVADRAVVAVRPEPSGGAAVATGDRGRAQDRTLLEVIDRAAAARSRVAFGLDGDPEVLQGTLAGVGEDVVTLRLDGRAADLVYVRVAAVTEVVLSTD